MLQNSRAFSSFSVNDIQKAKEFYGKALGLKVTEEKMPNGGKMLTLHLEGGAEILVYAKEDHKAATYTVLNFPVQKIESEVASLKAKGITFEKYESTDADGINRQEGPVIAWFKDPAGNFISLIEEASMSMSDAEDTTVKVTKFIPIVREKLFMYWTRPELLEKWSFPDGMKLKVPQYEARVGGQYRFEHTGQDGKYSCTGYIKEFLPNDRLVMMDSTILGPDGTTLYQDLECAVTFTKLAAGTEMTVIQTGFKDAADARECEQGWTQSLDNLSNLLSGGMGTRPSGSAPVDGKDLYHS